MGGFQRTLKLTWWLVEAGLPIVGEFPRTPYYGSEGWGFDTSERAT
jgi:hypothetical protein